MGRDSVGKIVMVGSGVVVIKGVLVGIGLAGIVGVRVALAFRVSKPNASTDAAPNTRIAPVIPPMIHGIQLTLRGMTNLKVGGTAIKTTVMLSCPPRELAISINAREASLRLGFERMTSRISSFQ